MSKPTKLKIRSFWLPDYRNKDIEIPDASLKDDFKRERDWRLILLRLRWGATTYEVWVNSKDELELRNLGRMPKSTWK